jgi:hypothetical protein
MNRIISFKKPHLLLVIGLLTIIILILLGRLIAYKKAIANATFVNNYELITDLSIAEKRIDALKRKQQIGIETAHCFIPDNLLLDINTMKSVNLKNVLNGRTSLLYRFTESSCLECVIEDLKSLNLIADNLSEKIVIIGGYETVRSFKAFTNNMDLKFRCFNFPPSLDIPMETETNATDTPYFMVVKPNLEIIFPYVRDGKDQTEKYLDRISRYIDN